MSDDANILELNSFQTLLHQIPGDTSIAAATGRGVGKSTGFATMMLRGCETYGTDYRALYLRKTYKGLGDFEQVLLDLFSRAYGGRKKFQYNQTEHILRPPTGSYIELGELGDQAAYDKYQGRSFTEIYIDEAQQFADPRLIDLLMSNLRSAKTPTRAILGCNPMGPGHEFIRQRYVDRAAPWTPFRVNGRVWVRASGNYTMNDKINQDEYLRNLMAATAGDSARRRAWIEGDFNVDAGAFFARAFSEKRNVIETSPDIWPQRHLWEWELAHDWGFSAPSATLLIATSMDSMWGPDDRYYPKGSVIVADEYVSNENDSLNVGLRLTIPDLAEEIHEMVRRWSPHAKPKGVADDAIAAARGDDPKTFQQEFKRCGIDFKPAKKGERVPSLARLTRYLAGAGSMEQPGLYINRRCQYLLRTLPMAQRSEKDPEDMDCDFDHAIDALRYALTPATKGQSWCVTQKGPF